MGEPVTIIADRPDIVTEIPHVTAYDGDGVIVPEDSSSVICKEISWKSSKAIRRYILRCRRGMQAGQLYDPDKTLSEERFRKTEEGDNYHFERVNEVCWNHYLKYLQRRSQVDFNLANREANNAA